MKKGNKNIMLSKKSQVITIFFAVSITVFSIFFRKQIPTHDMLLGVLNYLALGREWISTNQITTWNPFRMFGTYTFEEFVFLTNPFQLVSLLIARLIPNFNAVTVSNITYIIISIFCAFWMYKLGFSVTKSKISALYSSLCVLFFSIWFASPSFNLTIYWILPASLYSFTVGLRKNRVDLIIISLFLLLVGSFLGNGYLGIMSVLGWSIFAITYKLIEKIKFSLKNITLFQITISSIFLVAIFIFLLSLVNLIFVHNEIMYLSTDRLGKGIPTFDNFLTYATPKSPFYFRGIFIGQTHAMDSVSYIGFLTIPFFIYNLLFALDQKKYVPFYVTASFFFLLACGSASFVAPIMGKIPGVGVYRHLGPLTALFKFFLIIPASNGFKQFLIDHKKENDILTTGSKLLFCFLPTIFSLFHQIMVTQSSTNVDIRHIRLALTSVFILLLTVSITAASIKKFKRRSTIVVFVFIILTIDGASFYFERVYEYFVPVTHEHWEAFNINRPYEYSHMRNIEPKKETKEFLSIYEAWPVVPVTAIYDNIYQLFYDDICFSKYRRFVATPGVGEYLKTINMYDGKILDNSFVKKLSKRDLKDLGCTFDKVQISGPKEYGKFNYSVNKFNPSFFSITFDTPPVTRTMYLAMAYSDNLKAFSGNTELKVEKSRNGLVIVRNLTSSKEFRMVLVNKKQLWINILLVISSLFFLVLIFYSFKKSSVNG